MPSSGASRRRCRSRDPQGHHDRRFPAVRQDGTWIRATSRIGIGFVNEAGVVRGYDAAYLAGGPGTKSGPRWVAQPLARTSYTLCYSASNAPPENIESWHSMAEGTAPGGMSNVADASIPRPGLMSSIQPSSMMLVASYSLPLMISF